MTELAAGSSNNTFRRSLESFPNVFTLGGDLSINRINSQVFVGPEQVRLSPKEYTLLLVFAQHVCEGRIGPLTRKAIMEAAYSADELRSNTIEVMICRIRKKLEKSAVEIKTVYSKGYEMSMRDGSKVGVYAPE